MMENEPLVSIIVPVYKVEAYLDDCVNSLVHQSFQNLEIILVEDGSPDRCPNMCDAWKIRDKRIQVIHKENGGLSDARNAGLAIANGAYISFVDSDDIVSREMIQQLVDIAVNNKADIVECDFVRFEGQLPEIEDTGNIVVHEYDTKNALMQLMREQDFHYVVWNKLFHRGILSDLGFETGKLHEDIFFSYQAFGKSKKILKLECPLYYYRQRNDSIMGDTFSRKTMDSFEARKQQLLYMRKYFPQLTGTAQEQLIGSCMYFGQLALRSQDSILTEYTFQIVNPIFKEEIGCIQFETSWKQKLWYVMASLSLEGCCRIRNWLKIGL